MTLDWFCDFKLKCGGKLKLVVVESSAVDLDLGLILWFLKLKCWRKLEMIDVDSSAVNIDLESIQWFWIEMLLSMDLPTVELDPELILRFQVEMSRQLVGLDPCWFYDFDWKWWGKLELIRQKLTLILDWFYSFELEYWSGVTKIIWGAMNITVEFISKT